MKLCVLLFGLSYSENTKNYYTHKNTKIDYRLSFDNYKKYIYEYFEDLGYEIDTYLCTNFSNNEIQNQIIEDYSPKDYLFLEEKELEAKYLIKIHNRNLKFLNVMKLVQESGNEYDLCLITRFDLNFNIQFSDVNIMLDRMNVVSMLERKNLICDNFYILPFNKLPLLIKFTEEHLFDSFHYFYKNFKKLFNLNFLLDERKRIILLSFYDIIRIKNS